MTTFVEAFAVGIGLDPSQFKKGSKEVSDSTRKLREASQKDAAGVEKAMDAAGESVERLARNFLKLFALFTAGRAVKDFVTDITSADAALGRLAKSIGSTPEAVSSLANAVARGGGSASGAAASFEKLSDSIMEIRTTGNSSVLPVFARLQGISGKQIRLNTDLAASFGDLADAAKGTADKVGAPLADYMLKQAGYDQGTRALLLQGREKLNEALEKSRKIGIVRKEDSEAAQKLETSVEGLRQTSENLGRTILTAVTPTITELIGRFQNWIDANKEWIKTSIVEKIQQFAEWLKGIDWTAVVKGMETFGAAAVKVADAFGGVLKICEALFLFWVGSKALAIVSSILRVAGLLTSGPLGWAIGLAMASTGAAQTAQEYSDAKKNDPETKRFDDERIEQRGRVRAAIGRGWNAVKRAFGGGEADAHEGGAGIRTRAARAKRGPDGIPYEAKSLNEGVGINGKQYDAYREGLTDIEGKSYTQVGGYKGRYSGRYQFGPNEIRETATKLGETPPSREQFLADPAMQERYMERYTLDHHNYLMRKSPEYAKLSPEKKLEILGYAHNQGAGGAAKYLATGRAGSDGFGTSGTAYFDPIRRRLAAAGQPSAPATSNPEGAPDPTDGKGANGDLMKVIKRAQEISEVKFHVHEGLRTLERQKEMVDRGWSKTMNSKHLTGRAIDLRANGDPAVGDLDAAKYGKINDAVAKASKELGVPVEWGGNWKGFKDVPHFQLPDGYKSDAKPYPGDSKPGEAPTVPSAIPATAPAPTPKTSTLDAQRAGAMSAIAQTQAAQAAMAGNTSNDNRSTSSEQWHIGSVNLQTAATDGRAAAHEFRDTLRGRSYAAAANTGLA